MKLSRLFTSEGSGDFCFQTFTALTRETLKECPLCGNVNPALRRTIEFAELLSLQRT